ncbi:N-acetylmuramoyl-L-alanine amidase [Vibrio ziniensis]|uniref:Lysozyme n=1 Tax=Vibrio ziniensis TaxID=2711221 RepID=A0A6G7CLM9_9VIBR|nr:N-acetylmuramoyl-L-alanine amidase [Vibrio ziniensis]QIH42984.1 lysozyme [Vibrio ziniensis]
MTQQHQPMWITVHCSATPHSMDIGCSEIRRWHLQRGWQDIGYHYVIRRNGTIEQGRPLLQQGAHVTGNNKGNIGICLVGGCDNKQKPQDNFTLAQRKSLFTLIEQLQQQYNIDDKHVTAHSQWNSSKACPVIVIQSEAERQEANSLLRENV